MIKIWDFLHFYIFLLFKYYFILLFNFLKSTLERERGWERERNIEMLFHSFIHLFVGSHMCPDWGLNPQPWHIRPMF